MKDWADLRIEEMEEKATNSGFDFVVIDPNPDEEGDLPFLAYMEDAYYASISDRLLNRIHVSMF